MKLLKDFIITLGREYGSEGEAIAEDIGKALAIKVYDKNMIEMLQLRNDRSRNLLMWPARMFPSRFMILCIISVYKEKRPLFI